MALGAKLKDAREKRRVTPSEVAAATRMKVQIVEDLEREDFSRIAAPVYGKGFIKLYAEFVGLNPKPLIDEYVARFVDPPPPGNLGGEVTFQDTEPEAEEEESELSEDSPFGLGNETQHGEPDLFSHAAHKDDTPRPNRKSGLSGLFGKFRKAGHPAPSDPAPEPTTDTSGEGTNEGLEVGEDYARYSDEGPGPTRHSHSRIGLAAVGILLIFLFLVSCVRQCRREPAPDGTLPASDDPSSAKLEVALEPEEPYID